MPGKARFLLWSESSRSSLLRLSSIKFLFAILTFRVFSVCLILNCLITALALSRRHDVVRWCMCGVIHAVLVSFRCFLVVLYC
jgi:hypothetical protein